MNYPVSIIVPIYNVEKYIEKCVVSIFEQDFERDIEYIFVNDSTPDKSMEILDNVLNNYPEKKEHTIILNHKENKGLGFARKTGFEKAHGEYILHIDSDDWCELNMVSELYTKAEENNADIVICDFFNSYLSGDIIFKQHYSNSKQQNFSNLLLDILTPSVWNKLIKKTLYTNNDIFPPTAITNHEDKWLLVRLMYFANNIVYIEKPLYHWRKDNINSLSTKTGKKVCDDIRWYSQTTQEFLQEHKIFEQYKTYFFMSILLHMLWLTKGVDVKKWVFYVSPSAWKFSYLLYGPRATFLEKIVYSFVFLHMSWVTRLFIRLKKFLF
ncbi:glycoside transferase family 2 [Candidatus Gracilibacteria bacterium]|nr:MAG: glycoside transferase family 2 [Candidatus Gracilibacteria bacterium]